MAVDVDVDVDVDVSVSVYTIGSMGPIITTQYYFMNFRNWPCEPLSCFVQ